MRERESVGEWRVVRRRGVVRPVSERNPVRHSYYPSRRFNPRQQHVGVRNGFSQDRNKSISGIRDGRQFDRQFSDGDTFFFNNLPEGCWLETLRKRFSSVRKVVDSFCPKKRDARGRPFGFVRFEKGGDMEGILAELNNIWIGSYKLRAYVPRYDRPSLMEQKQAENDENGRGM